MAVANGTDGHAAPKSDVTSVKLLGLLISCLCCCVWCIYQATGNKSLNAMIVILPSNALLLGSANAVALAENVL